MKYHPGYCYCSCNYRLELICFRNVLWHETPPLLSHASHFCLCLWICESQGRRESGRYGPWESVDTLICRCGGADQTAQWNISAFFTRNTRALTPFTRTEAFVWARLRRELLTVLCRLSTKNWNQFVECNLITHSHTNSVPPEVVVHLGRRDAPACWITHAWYTKNLS